MGGHGTAIGGIVTDAGTFEWSDPKFVQFTREDKNYHGLRWALDPAPGVGEDRLRPPIPDSPAPQPGGMPFPGQRVDVPFRAWKPCTSHAQALRERPGCRGILEGTPEDSLGEVPRTGGRSIFPDRFLVLKNGFGGMVVFGVKGAGRREKSSSRACPSSPIWRTWGMRNPWPCTRRARPTPSSPTSS
jgi:O-acetylhomoserine (thiol)-lyase